MNDEVVSGHITLQIFLNFPSEEISGTETNETELDCRGLIGSNVATDGLQALRWLLEEFGDASPLEHLRGIAAPKIELVLSLARELGGIVAPVLTHLRGLSAAGPDRISIHIVASDDRLLYCPWEIALVNAIGQPVEHLCELGNLSRSSVRPLGKEESIKEEEGPLHIVSVSPRPFGAEDVAQTETLGPVVESVLNNPERLGMQLVRPATWRRTRDALSSAPSGFVFHFDGHGFRDQQGQIALVLEPEDPASPHVVRVDSQILCESLGRTKPRLVLLHACQSATSSGISHSLASKVSDATDAVVVGMAYSVRDSTVGILVKSVLDGLTRAVAISCAVGRAQREILRLSRLPGGIHKWTDIAIPIVIDKLARFRHSKAFEGELEAGTALQSSRSSLLLAASEELWLLDRTLRDYGGEIEIAGGIRSGKTTFCQMFESFMTVTRTHENPTAVSARLLEVRSGHRSAPESRVRFRMPRPHPRMLSEWLSKHIRAGSINIGDQGMTPGTMPFEISRLLGSHWGSMATFDQLVAGGISGEGAWHEIRWGVADEISLEELSLVRSALSELPTDLMDRAAILGVIEGAFSPLLISLVAAVGVREGSQESFGENSEEVWSTTLDELSLIGLIDSLEPPDWFEIHPLIARVLRERLLTLLGPEGSYELQLAVCKVFPELLHGWLVGRGGFLGVMAREIASLGVSLYEGLISRCFSWALKERHEELLGEMFDQIFRAVSPSEDLHDRLLSLIHHELTVSGVSAGELKSFNGYMSLIGSARALALQRWSECVLLIDNALALGEGDRSDLATSRVLIVRARANWHLWKFDAAREDLARARRVAADESDVDAVARSLEELEYFERAGVAERRPGDHLAISGELGEALRLEEEGQPQAAANVMLAAARRAGHEGDRVAMAEQLAEAGRIAALAGMKEAVELLERSVALKLELGQRVVRALYYLAIALEVTDCFEEALNTLDLALDRLQAENSEVQLGDLKYERGLVQLRHALSVGELTEFSVQLLEGSTRDFDQAAGYYAEWGSWLHWLDARLNGAQARWIRGDHEEAIDLLAQAKAGVPDDIIQSRSAMIRDIELQVMVDD